MGMRPFNPKPRSKDVALDSWLFYFPRLAKNKKLDIEYDIGNINILRTKQNLLKTQILNPHSNREQDYLEEIADTFNRIGNFDIIVASAGFDEYEKDWGGKLSTKAYNQIGKLMKDFSEDKCQGRRYALLEGGYYHEDFGINVHSFCQGFE